MSVLIDAVVDASGRDYQEWGYFLDTQGLIPVEGERKTETIRLQVPQQDTLNNPNEMPSSLGRRFAQSDWSHGSGQGYFHKQSSDIAKYLESEGFDVSSTGTLKHLPAVATAAGGALTAGSSGRSAQAGSAVFVADGTGFRRYDSITAAATTENPHAAEGAVTVEDVTSEGTRIFAALGANGIHVRNSAGVWSHYSDALAIRVAFVKDRLMAATATNIYEITAAGAAPAPLLTLKEGWTFTDIGEAGGFIFASAIHVASGLCRVHSFGLNDALALAPQTSTWFPENDLIYSFKGHLGTQVLLGGGRKNSSGGKDALLYAAEVTANGGLTYRLISDSKGAGSRDLACRAMTTYGRKVLWGRTLGVTSPFGEREGLAFYDPALDSYGNHLASSVDTVTPDPVLSVTVFGGRIVFVTIDGVYYEDTTKLVASATLITSIANWNNAGLKTWDVTDITHKALPTTSSIEVEYTTSDPEGAVWTSLGSSTIPDSRSASFSHPTVESQRFTLRFTSTATSTQALAPELETFSTRSNPSLEDGEYRLQRTVQINPTDRMWGRAMAVTNNTREVRDFIRSKYLKRITWYEADVPNGWDVRLTDIIDASPLPKYDSSSGQQEDETYVLTLVMEGVLN